MVPIKDNYLGFIEGGIVKDHVFLSRCPCPWSKVIWF